MQSNPKGEKRETLTVLGGLVGSLNLNEGFEGVVRDLVGEDQWLSLRGTRSLEQAARKFNKTIKLQFGGDVNERYSVGFLPTPSLKDDSAKDLKRNLWRMKGFVHC
jgi:hypothetical protein